MKSAGVAKAQGNPAALVAIASSARSLGESIVQNSGPHLERAKARRSEEEAILFRLLLCISGSPAELVQLKP